MARLAIIPLEDDYNRALRNLDECDEHDPMREAFRESYYVQAEKQMSKRMKLVSKAFAQVTDALEPNK